MAEGRYIVSPGPGSTVTGGAGDDTIQASAGPDQLIGGDGGDTFRYTSLPWSAGHVTDFVVGTDHLDLNQLFTGYGYSGSDPVADRRVTLQSDGADGTKVFFDGDAPDTGEWPTLITTLDHVSPDGLTWAQLGPLPPKVISITPNTTPHLEGNSGATPFPFTITRSGPADAVASVHWAVETVDPGDPGARPSDFAGGVYPSGDVTFNPGETSKTVVVEVAGDTNVEFNESFLVRISNPTGGTLSASYVAAGGIYSDDGPTHARFEFSTPTVSHAEGNSGVTDFTFTIVRSGPTDTATIADYRVVAGGMTAADFAGGVPPPSRSVVFQDGETSHTITIQVAGDTTVEGDETFSVELFNGGGAEDYELGPAASGIVVNDDGGAPPTPSGSGQVINSRQYGDTLTGGSGDDTLNAGQGPDQLTGAGGADQFTFANLPWNAGRSTDFTVGSDRLDLSALFKASGYAGSDPIADGYVFLQADGSGGTTVRYDTDGPGSGNTIQFVITDLEHVSPAGLTWAKLSGGATSPPPPGDGGQVLTSDQYGDTLTGGAGNDTLNAGRGPDQLTGAGGADHFAFGDLPWSAGGITDFTPGVDKLDLRPVFAASGYAGTDPIGDHRLEFRSDGAGNTEVYFDRDAAGSGDWPFLITTLERIAPGQITASDWLFSAG